MHFKFLLFLLITSIFSFASNVLYEINFETSNENWQELNSHIGGSLKDSVRHSTDGSTSRGCSLAPMLPAPNGNFILEDDEWSGQMSFTSPTGLNKNLGLAFGGELSFDWLNQSYDGNGTGNSGSDAMKISLVDSSGREVFATFNGAALINSGWHKIRRRLNDATWSGTENDLRLVLSDLDRIVIRIEAMRDKDFEGGMVDCNSSEYFALDTIKFTYNSFQLNVERVNSLTQYTSDSSLDHKYNLYTQIAKRDFNYTVVFYDDNITIPNKEKAVSGLTVKVDLINGSDSNSTIATTVATFNNQARVDILSATDLTNTPSTQNAYFNISYPVDSSGTVIGNSSCLTIACLQGLPNFNSFRVSQSRDIFAIRPAGFGLDIWTNDNNATGEELQTNEVNTSISLAAGEEYKLDVKALGYNDSNETGYRRSSSTDFNSTLEFQGNVSCAVTTDEQLGYHAFANGVNNVKVLEHDNVGPYLLYVLDTGWTSIDHSADNNKRGCVLNSSSNTVDSTGRVGCDIHSEYESQSSTYHNMPIVFEPYRFDVDMVMTKQPNAGKSFLYMSDLNVTEAMAIHLDGNITAKEKGGNVTTNFTTGCHARDVDFTLNYLATTADGNFSNTTPLLSVQTTDGMAVNLQRKIKHNDQAYLPLTSSNVLDTNITLLESYFEDNRTIKGSTYLSILYNIQKNLSRTINPVQINFQEVRVKSDPAISQIDNNLTYIPWGLKTLDSLETFYFSRVAPDQENYPPTDDISQRTPFMIEIFCDFNISWCSNIIPTSNGLYSNHTQSGWYTSRTHNTAIDGNFTLTIVTPGSDFSLDGNLTTDRGRIDDTEIRYVGFLPTNTTNPTITAEVSIVPISWLKYYPDLTRTGNPFYRATFRNPNFGTMSGIGSTGNLLRIDSNEKSSNKVSW